MTLMYDVKLIMSMVQRLSGRILPQILTKEVTIDELANEERRSELAWELSEFFCDSFKIELGEDGIIEYDFYDELQYAL